MKTVAPLLFDFQIVVLQEKNSSRIKFQKMNWREHIVSDPEILLGKPTLKGTRLSVEFILERLSSGWTEQMLLENAPRLTREHLKAVYQFQFSKAQL